MTKKLTPLFVLAVLLLPITTQAAIITSAPVIDFAAILGRIKDILWIIFTGLVVIMFIIVGFLYLTARGEPSKVQVANKALIWTVVGVAVGVLANSAYNLVKFIIFPPPP